MSVSSQRWQTPSLDGPVTSSEPRPRHALHPVLVWLFAAASFAPLAALAYLPSWLHWYAQMNGTNEWDRNLENWFLAWTPFAITHGHAVFVSHWQFVPGGINLMWNTSDVFVGLLASPLTAAVGAANSYSVLATVALATSAASMYLLLKRWVSWVPGAWLGGLLYGFSPYFVAEGLGGRLHLLVAAAPPLIILLLDKLWSEPNTSPRAVGICLGLLGAAQLLISEETLAVAALYIAAGLAFTLLFNWRRAQSLRAHFTTAFAWAAGVFIVVTAYPLFVQFFGPYRVTGAVQTPVHLALFSADLASFVIPGVNQLLVTPALTAISNGFATANPPEVTAYVGLPLLLFLAVGAVVGRRDRRLVLAMGVAALGAVFALGPHLVFLKHVYLVHLPEAVLAHLPLITSVVPSRYAIGLWLGAAPAAALILDKLHGWLGRRRHGLAAGVSLGVGIVVLVPLIPSWPYPSVSANVPSFFTTRAVDAVPNGSVAIVYPIPRAPYDQALLWQADAGMRFRQPGGYAIGPSPSGAATFFPFPNDVENCLDQLYSSGAVPAGICDRGALLPSLRQLRARAIVIPVSQPYAALARRTVAQALHQTPVLDHGVWLWSCAAKGSAPWCASG